MDDRPELVSVGPGSVTDEQVDIKPTLEGATDYEYVEIVNPLSVPFMGKYAVERPVNVQFKIQQDPLGRAISKTADDVSRNYGLGDLKNPDHPSKARIQNDVVIKPGQTIRLGGAAAQVIVKQLVDAIIALEDNKIKLADPGTRQRVEQRIILRRGSMNEFMQAPQSIPEQLDNALKESQNEEFPGLKQDSTEESEKVPAVNEPSERRKPGRPPKPATNPA